LEENVTKKNFAVLVLLLFLLSACTSENQSQQPGGCLENKPESIPGLKVLGERSEKNVINNLWPVVCKAQEMYRERLKDNPRLKGSIELKLSVEFNGEIGPYSIARSTLKDPVLEDRLLRFIAYMDFDPYGPRNSESSILFPIHFQP
jgi:hypothetical protein